MTYAFNIIKINKTNIWNNYLLYNWTMFNWEIENDTTFNILKRYLKNIWRFFSKKIWLIYIDITILYSINKYHKTFKSIRRKDKQYFNIFSNVLILFTSLYILIFFNIRKISTVKGGCFQKAIFIIAARLSFTFIETKTHIVKIYK